MRVWTAGPDTGDARPALLMLHERYGPVRHSFNVIERLAGDGFVAVMMDLFHRYTGDRKPIEDAQARIDPTDAEQLADLDETIDYVRTLPYVDGGSIGIAGFCLSGRTPLVYAAERDAASAIAVVHGGAYPRDYDGSVPGQAKIDGVIAKVTSPVFAAFGELDELVPLENVRRFRGDLEAAGVTSRIRVFAGMPHGWLNSTTPERYRPEQADETWESMAGFFRSAFDGTLGTESSLDADPSIAFDFTGGAS